MRRSFGYLSLLLYGVSLASAQTAFDVNMGFGTAFNSATGNGLDNAASANAFGTCTPSSGDINCLSTPKLGGFFLGLGGDLMLYKHFGVGAEINFQPGQSNYGPLQYRQTFWDVNGIYQPVNRKRVSLQLQGGIGAARTSFSYSQSSCVGTAVCSTQAQPVGNSTHFQVHTGVGVQFFVTSRIFIRPQFDLHYVPNFTEQFGRNAVPEATVWVGYSFGREP